MKSSGIFTGKGELRRSIRRGGVAACFAAALLGAAGAGPASAQGPEDRVQAAAAALQALRPRLPEGKAAWDPEPLCQARLVGWNCPPELVRAAEELRLTLSSRLFTQVCVGGTEHCRLLRVNSLIRLDPAEFSERSAVVHAQLWQRVSARSHPLRHQRFVVRLSRRGAGWVVDDVDGA